MKDCLISLSIKPAKAVRTAAKFPCCIPHSVMNTKSQQIVVLYRFLYTEDLLELS